MAGKSVAPLSCYCADHCQFSQALSVNKAFYAFLLCGMRLSFVIYVFYSSRQRVLLKINIIFFICSLKVCFIPDWHFISL
jgi:hypothetical protein